MMILRIFIYSLVLMLNAQLSLANQLTSDKLIESCKEAVSIYTNKAAELKSYAALTTSLSEAFKGGYCAGVIQGYLISNSPYCRNQDWFQEAKRIAKYDPSDHKRIPIKKLLSTACY